jgi:hypothetical protein
MFGHLTVDSCSPTKGGNYINKYGCFNSSRLKIDGEAHCDSSSGLSSAFHGKHYNFGVFRLFLVTTIEYSFRRGTMSNHLILHKKKCKDSVVCQFHFTCLRGLFPLVVSTANEFSGSEYQ